MHKVIKYIDTSVSQGVWGTDLWVFRKHLQVFISASPGIVLFPRYSQFSWAEVSWIDLQCDIII